MNPMNKIDVCCFIHEPFNKDEDGELASGFLVTVLGLLEQLQYR